MYGLWVGSYDKLGKPRITAPSGSSESVAMAWGRHAERSSEAELRLMEGSIVLPLRSAMNVVAWAPPHCLPALFQTLWFMRFHDLRGRCACGRLSKKTHWLLRAAAKEKGSHSNGKSILPQRKKPATRRGPLTNFKCNLRLCRQTGTATYRSTICHPWNRSGNSEWQDWRHLHDSRPS